MTSQIMSLDEIFKDSTVSTDESVTDLSKIFSDKPPQGSDEALAEFVGHYLIFSPVKAK